jgi:purine-cytosine permease-like protein
MWKGTTLPQFQMLSYFKTFLFICHASLPPMFIVVIKSYCLENNIAADITPHTVRKYYFTSIFSYAD